MYFFELSNSQIKDIKETGTFNINGAIMYDTELNEFHIKLLTLSGYRSKKPLKLDSEFIVVEGCAEINSEIAKNLIANYTNLPKTFETPDEKFQREKTAGMIALAKRITDEIR